MLEVIRKCSVTGFKAAASSSQSGLNVSNTGSWPKFCLVRMKSTVSKNCFHFNPGMWVQVNRSVPSSQQSQNREHSTIARLFSLSVFNTFVFRKVLKKMWSKSSEHSMCQTYRIVVKILPCQDAINCFHFCPGVWVFKYLKPYHLGRYSRKGG